MPPLNAAFAFPEMDHFTVLVTQHLKLDVPRMLEKLFRVNVRRAKGLLGLATGRLVGGPAVFTSLRARSFSPIISMISGLGPMKVISEASQTLAKLAFSERNPYPGWIASTFVISAALITWGMFK